MFCDEYMVSIPYVHLYGFGVRYCFHSNISTFCDQNRSAFFFLKFIWRDFMRLLPVGGLEPPSYR
jgi:hypothetical protein